MSNIQLESEIICPKCSFSKIEKMPLEFCQFFYECQNCQTVIRPESEDCCVFCSFGSVKCPPVQKENSCCRE